MTDLNDFGRRYAEAWCSQNPENVAAFFAEKGSLAVNGGPPAVGRAAIAEVARGFMRDFPDLIVTMDKLEPGATNKRPKSGDVAVFHWTLTGTNTGPGGTASRVRIHGYEVWKIDDHGLIEQSKGHFDAAEYDRQLKHGVDG